MSPRRKAAKAETTAPVIESEDGEQLQFAIPETAYELDVIYVDHGQIYPDPDQPRTVADAELRAEIAAEGIRQPIEVRPRTDLITGGYWIVDGERRWRSAAGVQQRIPCIVRPDREDDALRLASQITANSGKPLTPIEEALAYRRLVNAGMSVTELAAVVKKPRTTVGERLNLLEIGPWLELVGDGAVPYSHAVQHLVPLRGVPNKYHAEAIGKCEKGYRWSHRGGEAGGAGMSSGDFGRLIDMIYRPFFYPLTRTKTSWNKQPEFDTRNHDAECDCGGMSVALDGAGSKRKCCGNPDWWRPLHRKAAAAKKKTAPKKTERASGPKKLELELPAGTKTVKESVYDGAPKGVTMLTDSYGHWKLNRYGWKESDEDFDPADLVIDEAKLVRVANRYSGDTVGTRDTEALKAARAAWQERWAKRRKELLDILYEDLQHGGSKYRIDGAGAYALLVLACDPGNSAVDLVFDVADALELDVPLALRAARHDRAKQEMADWLGGLEAEDLSNVATGVAYLADSGHVWPFDIVRTERLAALEKLSKLAHPWVAKPKTAAKKKAATKAATKSAKKKAAKESPVDRYKNGDPKDTPAARTERKRARSGHVTDGWQVAAGCIICGCTDDHACEGGCSWLAVNREGTTHEGVCSLCADNDDDAQGLLDAWLERAKGQVPELVKAAIAARQEADIDEGALA